MISTRPAPPPRTDIHVTVNQLEKVEERFKTSICLLDIKSIRNRLKSLEEWKASEESNEATFSMTTNEGIQERIELLEHLKRSEQTKKLGDIDSRITLQAVTNTPPPYMGNPERESIPKTNIRNADEDVSGEDANDDQSFVQRKKIITAHVVIIMDSNRRYIKKEKFWHGKKVFLIKSGDAKEAAKVLNENEFRGVKHFITHVGTNDVESDEPAEIIGSRIVRINRDLKIAYPNAHIYSSSIPAREETRRHNKAMQVNHYLSQSLPESVSFIDNEDVTVDDLEIERHLLGNSKHIKQNSIHKIVGNFKAAIRKKLSDSERRFNGKPQVEPRKQQRGTKSTFQQRRRQSTFSHDKPVQQHDNIRVENERWSDCAQQDFENHEGGQQYYDGRIGQKEWHNRQIEEKENSSSRERNGIDRDRGLRDALKTFITAVSPLI